MPVPGLRKFEQKIERQLRLLELRKTIIERKIEHQVRLFEQKRNGIGRKIEDQIRQFERKHRIRLDDEVRFIRSWIERPLSIGAVTPSGKLLARTMAGYGPGRRSTVSPRAGRIQSDVLPNSAFALPRGDFGAGRRLQHAPPA
jgi:hypothetical protein